VTELENLYNMLKRIQEPKGYLFNSDIELVFYLLNGLILNRQRYGYMSCPCRLSADDRERDRDIICPCEYRKADVEEFGSCYCGLYVSREWNEGSIEHTYVPERRPPEKISV
jgi:ferredoxin-thioredoxin reductase catalytic subunit